MAGPYTTTLQQFLLDLGLLLDDAKLLTATGGSTSTFVTTELSGQNGSDFVGSELMLWDKPAAMTAANPLVVADTPATANTLPFLVGALGPNPVAAGNRAVLQNINGRGYSQDKKLFATRMALMDDYPLTHSMVPITTGFDTVNFWQPLPASLRSVYRVTVTINGDVFDIGPHIWGDINLNSRLIYIPYLFGTSDSIQVYGRLDPATTWTNDPASLTAAMPFSSPDLLRSAAHWLLLSRRDGRDREDLQIMYQDRLRTRRDLPLPSEVFLV